MNDAHPPRLPKYATIRLLEQDAAHLWAAWLDHSEALREPTMADARVHAALADAADVPAEQYRETGLVKYARQHVLRKD